MSGKKKNSKTVKKERTAPVKRPAGFTEEEYEEYLDNLRREEQLAEIEAERLRFRKKYADMKSKTADAFDNMHIKAEILKERKKEIRENIGNTADNTKQKTVNNILAPVDRFFSGFFSGLSAVLQKTAMLKCSVLLFILFAFAVLTVNNYICGFNLFDLTPSVGRDTYQFYLCDYSCGFVSRVLIGAVITHFTDTVTVELIGLITSIANIISVVLNSVLIGIGLKYSLKKRNYKCFVICISALACPLIAIWGSVYYGFLDMFLFICFLLSAFSSKGPLKMIIPAALCALGLCIHYSYMFQFAPAVLCVLFYAVFCESNRKKNIINITGFGLSAVVTAGLFIWFAVFASNYLKCTADEYNAMMLSRFVIPDSIKEGIMPYYNLAVTNPDLTLADKKAIFDYLCNEEAIYKPYFDHYIFRIYNKQTASGFAEFFGNQFVYNDELRNVGGMLSVILLGCPYIIYSLVNSCKKFIKRKGVKKLPFLAVFAASLQIIPALALSVDAVRFVPPAVISALYMNYTIEYNDAGDRENKQKYSGLNKFMLCLAMAVWWTVSVIVIRKL